MFRCASETVRKNEYTDPYSMMRVSLMMYRYVQFEIKS